MIVSVFLLTILNDVFLGLTLLAKIGDAEANHEKIIENLDGTQYTTLSHNLCVPDAPIVIFSLEVLYKLSGLGEQHATLIAENSNNIGLLYILFSEQSFFMDKQMLCLSYRSSGPFGYGDSGN